MPLMSELLVDTSVLLNTYHGVRTELRSIAIGASVSYYAKFQKPCQSLHVLQNRVLAGVRCVDAQTLQAYSLVCPGKVPREQVHLAHMLGALWLFGLLCADWLKLQDHFFSFLVSKIAKRWNILFF